MVTWRLVLQGADVDGRNLLPPHLKSNCLCGLFFISVSTIIFIIKMLLTSAAWILF